LLQGCCLRLRSGHLFGGLLFLQLGGFLRNLGLLQLPLHGLPLPLAPLPLLSLLLLPVERPLFPFLLRGSCRGLRRCLYLLPGSVGQRYLPLPRLTPHHLSGDAPLLELRVQALLLQPLQLLF
jgi:hypothetical protein